MPLTDIAVRNAKGRDKPYKLADSAGLYLLVRPDGARYWRFDFRHLKKRKTLAFGVYPDVPLSAAREKRDAARKLVAAGKDPLVEKRREREAAEIAAGNTFKIVAEEWIEKKLVAQGRSEVTVNKIRWMLGFAYAEIGDDPVDEVKARDILVILERLQKDRLYETSRRLRSNLSRVFRFAVITGRGTVDPAAALAGALIVPKTKHHAALIDADAVGGLLRAIDSYDGDPQVALALKLSPLVFVRPGELRMAEWSEFNLDAAEWRIPGPKMKMKREHIVPLSTQAIDIIGQVKKLGRKGTYLFASLRTPDRPMSENTINAALRRLGYGKDEQTAHGFRTTASTMLNEMGWNRDWIERQLAHVDEDEVRRAYNAAEYLSDRCRMMQAWADHLDVLRKPKKNSTRA